jgi:uncharacterized protein (DUF2141 family)
MCLVLSGLAVSLIVSPVSAQQSSITVNVSGLHSQKGDLVVCLWKQADKDFPICSNSASFQHETVKAAASTLIVTFPKVPSGEYAISAFHDENENTKIDRNFMGKPKEGLAFSNMSENKGKRERPSFDKAKFTVNGAKTISMSLMYF